MRHRTHISLYLSVARDIRDKTYFILWQTAGGGDLRTFHSYIHIGLTSLDGVKMRSSSGAFSQHHHTHTLRLIKSRYTQTLRYSILLFHTRKSFKRWCGVKFSVGFVCGSDGGTRMYMHSMTTHRYIYIGYVFNVTWFCGTTSRICIYGVVHRICGVRLIRLIYIYMCVYVCEESANMCACENENFQEFNNIPHQPYIM